MGVSYKKLLHLQHTCGDATSPSSGISSVSVDMTMLYIRDELRQGLAQNVPTYFTEQVCGVDSLTSLLRAEK